MSAGSAASTMTKIEGSPRPSSSACRAVVHGLPCILVIGEAALTADLITHLVDLQATRTKFSNLILDSRGLEDCCRPGEITNWCPCFSLLDVSSLDFWLPARSAGTLMCKQAPLRDTTTSRELPMRAPSFWGALIGDSALEVRILELSGPLAQPPGPLLKRECAPGPWAWARDQAWAGPMHLTFNIGLGAALAAD